MLSRIFLHRKYADTVIPGIIILIFGYIMIGVGDKGVADDMKHIVSSTELNISNIDCWVLLKNFPDRQTLGKLNDFLFIFHQSYEF